MSLSFSWSRAGDSAPTANGSAAPPKLLESKPMVPIMDQLARAKEAWDPASPNCAFQYYFYNKVPADQAGFYTMPHGQDQAKWEKALADRPDANSVPVLAVGFNDLQTRAARQKEQINAYRVRMHEINNKLGELANRHDLHTSVKLAEMKKRHVELARKTLALVVQLQVLLNRGWALSPDEELYQKRLKQLLERADDPSVFGSLNEVWARLKAMREQAAHTNNPAAEQARLEWDRDSAQLERVISVLASQQTGIKFLTKLLEEDHAKVAKVLESAKDQEPAPSKPLPNQEPATVATTDPIPTQALPPTNGLAVYERQELSA